ncbi:MAG: MFS transporter [Candidatus Hodarchaeota archaeon]
MFIANFLGIKTIPAKAQRLIGRFLFLSILGAFLGNLSSTFFILFAIDKIGFVQASIVMSIMLFVQLITDYPSGSLGDWIGQRWVLVISFSCYAISYYLLTTAETFTNFLVLAFFNGLANAQASGTLATWLDNNYQSVVEEADPERKIYGFSMARIGSMNRIVMAIAFVTGGTMATLMSRQFVFFVQAAMSTILIIIALALVRDVKTPTIDQMDKKKTSLMDYLGFLKGGIAFLVSSKTAFFFIVGTSIIFAAFNVWGTLLLFPIYFGYTGSDQLASIFRTVMYFIGIPIAIYMAKVSKRFVNDTVPHFYIIGLLCYFLPFIVLLTLLPATNTINLLGIVITALVLTFANNVLLDVAETLRRRTMLDLVPSENRNAVYSLIPTLISIIAIPLLPIAGMLINDYGFTAGIIVSLVTSLVGASFVFLSLHFKKKSMTAIDKQSLIEEGIPS